MFEGYALIIGAMKSGTTTLHRLLSNHPEVTPAKPKEPNAFADHPNLTPEDYDSYFPALEKSRHKWALDSSTAYTKKHMHPDVAARIAKFPAKTRIIYIMRDPIKRIESQIAHNLHAGRKGAKSIKYPLQTSLYFSQLEPYDRAGIADEILLLNFDDLCNESQNTIDLVCDHLGISKMTISGSPKHNARRIDGVNLSEEQISIIKSEIQNDATLLKKRYGFSPSTWTSLHHI